MLESEDISSKFLRKKMGGYKTKDVDTLLKNVKIAYKDIQQENFSLLEEIKDLKNKLSRYKEAENIIHDTMINAQKSADLCIKEANYKASSIIEEAKEKANSLVEKTKYEIYDQEKVLQDLKNQNVKFRSKLLDSYKEHIRLIGVFPEEEKGESLRSSNVEIQDVPPIKITGIESEDEVNEEYNDYEEEEEDDSSNEVFDEEQENSKKTASNYREYKIKSLDKFSDLKFKERCCLEF